MNWRKPRTELALTVSARYPHWSWNLLKVLHKSAHAVQQAITALASHDHDAVAAQCMAIDDLERQADTLLRGCLEHLFAATSDAISLIKLKEIYELMEGATDRCKDVADTLRNVVVKQN